MKMKNDASRWSDLHLAAEYANEPGRRITESLPFS